MNVSTTCLLFEMTFCQTKGGTVRYVIMNNVILADKMTKSFVFRW